MKKYTVELMRRQSAFSSWYLSKKVTIEARTERSAYNKAEKQYANPYCKIGRIELEQ